MIKTKITRWVSNKLIYEILSLCGNRAPSISQCNLIADLVAYFEANPHCEHVNRLSERERTCLFWVAHGKKVEEIAKRMSIKECTVQTYRRRICTKLHCKTLAQAVFVSMCYKPASECFIFTNRQIKQRDF